MTNMTSTVSSMYDNSTSRLVELMAEASHYSDMALVKVNYINSMVTSMVNLIDQWIERDETLAARWKSDKAFILGQLGDIQRKIDKITVNNVDAMVTIRTGKDEPEGQPANDGN